MNLAPRDGGDELALGYDRYRAIALADRVFVLSARPATVLFEGANPRHEHRHGDTRALFRRRLDHEIRVEGSGAFAHVRDTDAVLGCLRRQREADAVVDDFQCNDVAMNAHAHVDNPRRGMFERIVERFLRNAIETIFHRRRQPKGAGDIQNRLDAGLLD